jgi:hypothetical protein
LVGAWWFFWEGVGAGVEMNQALYAHMNNKRKRKKKEMNNPKKN